jgi:hypothetical protein
MKIATLTLTYRPMEHAMKTTTKASPKKSTKAPIFAPSILAVDLSEYKSVATALSRGKGIACFIPQPAHSFR